MVQGLGFSLPRGCIIGFTEEKTETTKVYQVSIRIMENIQAGY